VSAKEKTTGKEQSIRIEAKSSLSKEDIEKMKKDAELHAEEDKKKRELVDVRNHADSLIYTAEKALKDAEGKIPEDVKKDVEEKITELRKVKDGNDEALIRSSSEALSQSMMKIGEVLSKAQSTDTPESPKDNPEGNVRDADVK